ncbi:MAG: D-alanyl-D-alanine carboxypeptidase family protein, partial [Saprospiraceae bacterium]|nr:D-alanyl-D-alanine carboxypeptidase family protein [Saprospiraceae bacterium]
TDLDLNAFNNAYFETGMGAPIYVWLVENAKDYGFCQPYTEKNILRPDGYEEEKWHWSYTPLAGEILHSAKSLLRDDLITGFQGAEVAKDLEVVQHYVLGINPDCTAAEPDPDR